MKTSELQAIQKEFSKTSGIIQALCKEAELLNSVVERMAQDIAELQQENAQLKAAIRKELTPPPAPIDDLPLVQGVLVGEDDTEPVHATMVYGKLVGS